MRLTTKSRYAVTAMLGLALHESKGPMTLAELSEKQGISLSYLEQLFAAMRARGLVKGVRGPGGGYYLGRKSQDISVADIICATDEWVEYTHANKQHVSIKNIPVTSRGLWDELSRQLFDFMENISLHDIVTRKELHQVAHHEKRIAA